MRSILSVIRKPLMTLMVEAVTATAPRIVLRLSFCEPSTTMEPTRLMAEMALVSDISGVCNRGDTRRITSKPRNVASKKTYKLGINEDMKLTLHIS
jgi:hypothetical protein